MGVLINGIFCSLVTIVTLDTTKDNKNKSIIYKSLLSILWITYGFEIFRKVSKIF